MVLIGVGLLSKMDEKYCEREIVGQLAHHYYRLLLTCEQVPRMSLCAGIPQKPSSELHVKSITSAYFSFLYRLEMLELRFETCEFHLS
jgi:hypothetical protein